jgi:GABA permease
VLSAYFILRRRPRVITLPEVAVAGGAGAAAYGDSSPGTAALGSVSRVLVVANETVQATALLTELRGLHDEHSARYFVCVPARPLHSGQGAVWAPDTAVTAAERRLETTLGILRGAGLVVEGEIGDYRPMHAMDRAVAEFRPDLIVISTHPEARSAWLRQNIVEQARRKYPVPVRHVVSVVPEVIFGT